MDDEKLFEMLDECVAYAVNTLENVRTLYPFAMVVDENDNIGSLNNDERDHEKCYELLYEDLKEEAQKGQVRAIALIARVNIPDNFSPAVTEGLRIHIEEKGSSGEKIGARLLYIPYQLFKTPEDDAKLTVKLHDPIPVGIPSEIFV